MTALTGEHEKKNRVRKTKSEKSFTDINLHHQENNKHHLKQKNRRMAVGYE